MVKFLSRLFGGGTPPEPEPTSEIYKGFTISPAPLAAGGEYRIGAKIEKDGRVHDLIRADTLRDRDAAISASLNKARQVIDEQGEKLFR